MRIRNSFILWTNIITQIFNHFVADFKPPVHHKKINSTMVAGVIAGAVFLLTLVLGFLHKKGYLGGKSSTDKGTISPMFAKSQYDFYRILSEE